MVAFSPQPGGRGGGRRRRVVLDLDRGGERRGKLRRLGFSGLGRYRRVESGRRLGLPLGGRRRRRLRLRRGGRGRKILDDVVHTRRLHWNAHAGSGGGGALELLHLLLQLLDQIGAPVGGGGEALLHSPNLGVQHVERHGVLVHLRERLLENPHALRHLLEVRLHRHGAPRRSRARRSRDGLAQLHHLLLELGHSRRVFLHLRGELIHLGHRRRRRVSRGVTLRKRVFEHAHLLLQVRQRRHRRRVTRPVGLGRRCRQRRLQRANAIRQRRHVRRVAAEYARGGGDVPVVERLLERRHLGLHLGREALLRLETLARRLRLLERVSRRLIRSLELLALLLLESRVLLRLGNLREELALALRAGGELGLLARLRGAVERVGSVGEVTKPVAERSEQPFCFAAASNRRRSEGGIGLGGASVAVAALFAAAAVAAAAMGPPAAARPRPCTRLGWLGPDAAQPSRRVGATKLRHGRGSGANARVKGAVAGPAPIAVRRNRRRGSRRGSIPRVRSSAALGAHPARGAATAERTGRAVLVRVANLLEGDDAAAGETRHVDVAETASVPAGTARASAPSPRRGGRGRGGGRGGHAIGVVRRTAGAERGVVPAGAFASAASASAARRSPRSVGRVRARRTRRTPRRRRCRPREGSGIPRGMDRASRRGSRPTTARPTPRRRRPVALLLRALIRHAIS